MLTLLALARLTAPVNRRGLLSLGAILLAASFGAARARASCDRPFDNPDQVLDLQLKLSRADWAVVRLAPAVGVGCDRQYPYVKAEFRCGNEQAWQTIGVRRKRGDQRGRDTDQKPPLKLDLNRYVTGQSWPAGRGDLGYRKLSLNNGQNDAPGGILPALLTEQIAWRLMRKEVPAASGVAYGRLRVIFTDNGAEEYHGLYIVHEDLDRSALRRRFGQARGRLAKSTGIENGQGGVCREQPVFDDGGDNEARTLYEAWWKKSTAGSYPGGWRAETERSVLLDDLLRQEAVRDVLLNGDDTALGSYWSNYYAYDPQQGRRQYFPWDMDDVFGRNGGRYKLDQPPSYPINPSCGELGKRTRCQAPIKLRYLEIMCQLVNGTLRTDNLLREWDHVDSVIRPLLRDEAALVWSGRDPLSPSIDGSYGSEFQRIRAWIPQRIADVRRQIVAAGFACPQTCTNGAREACSYLSCAGQRRCEDGAWTGCEPAAGLKEICGNGKDDTCNGQVDEGCAVAVGDGGVVADRAAPFGGTEPDAGAGPPAGKDASAAVSRPDVLVRRDTGASLAPEPAADPEQGDPAPGSTRVGTGCSVGAARGAGPLAPALALIALGCLRRTARRGIRARSGPRALNGRGVA